MRVACGAVKCTENAFLCQPPVNFLCAPVAKFAQPGQAVLQLVAHWYEHRGAVGHDLAVLVAPLGFEALVAPYRILSL